MASTKFINECKNGANSNRLGKITVEGVETPITNSDNLSSFTIDDACYADGKIIGTTYSKKLTAQLIAVPNDMDLIDKRISAEIGVKYADSSEETIKMGNYTIERPKDEQTKNSTQITAYDDFNLLDNPYICNLDFSNDVTISDFYIDVCNQLGLIPKTTTFLNSDIQVTANPFVNKEKLRVVLQEIEKVSCTFSEIDYETNEINLIWLSEGEEQTNNVYKNDEFISLYDFMAEHSTQNDDAFKNYIVQSSEIQVNKEASYRAILPELNLNTLSDDTNLETYTVALYFFDDSYTMVGAQLLTIGENEIEVSEKYKKVLVFLIIARTPDENNPSDIATPNYESIRNEFSEFKIYETAVKPYEFQTNDYTTLEGGKIVYGPVNCLVIKESQIEGENTTRQDDESIITNGETQIAIQDSYFLFTQALREQAIDNIWNRVKGLTYVDCKLTTSYGKPFLKKGQKIRINVNDGRIFDTYVLKHRFTYDGTFQSIIESPALTKQETKIKSKTASEAIRLTEIRVDKAEGNIKATTQKTQEISDNLNNNYYSKTNINELIQNAETGVTNTFSEAGGNNILRNTGLWFKNTAKDAEESPYEFWTGIAKEGKNNNATNYKTILLQNGSFIQEPVVPNGNYSISFYYKKLIELANASVVINDKEYSLDSLEVKQFYTGEQDSETSEYIIDPIVVSNNHIKIEFKCDTNDGVEVYDLMCNKGAVKLAYSQNQNETTTDTVNISKGITITSSTDENTKFKADYDGIRVLDRNNNPKTTFTDKGTETDELVVRKKATITSLLQQEVDDQTWVTKI